MVNSRLGLFTAPSRRSLRCESKDHSQKDPFSRSYGARLPSSLTRFLSRALVYSTFPPVSVLVRLPVRLARSFSWRYGFNGFALIGSASRLRLNEIRICLDLALHAYPGNYHRPGPSSLPRHSIADLLLVGSVGPEGLSLANQIRPGRS